jgi:peptidoglycan/xylan/chitin deacetylase (PgdA/CDA1 family)
VNLRSLKLAGLRAASALGLSSRLLESHWRRQRLLILCYHGVSLADEHQWNPALYLAPALFRQRLEALRQMDCAVLPLGEAVSRLYAGSLPKKSVAITFDDGPYDFYRVAAPMLLEYAFPATVYLTTYYSLYNRPVFDVMLPYLLWRGRGRQLCWPEWLPQPVSLDEPGRAAAQFRLKERAREQGWSARDKDQALAALAGKLEIDYEELCAQRILHLMSPEEASRLAAQGIDIQLHTHRHRVPLQRELFLREIQDNQRCLRDICPTPAVHFCYPGGVYRPEFAGFLAESGVVSATTSEAGLAHRTTNRFFLPRLLDTSSLTPVEFAAWVGGLPCFLPRRAEAARSQAAADHRATCGAPSGEPI